jgi:hypothetical protein
MTAAAQQAQVAHGVVAQIAVDVVNVKDSRVA